MVAVLLDAKGAFHPQSQAFQGVDDFHRTAVLLTLTAHLTSSCGLYESKYKEQLRLVDIKLGIFILMHDLDISTGETEKAGDKFQRLAVEDTLKKPKNSPASLAKAQTLVLEDYDIMRSFYRCAFGNEKMLVMQADALNARHGTIEDRLKILLN